MLTVHLPATTADVGRIMPVQPWVTAWQLALYGPDGFFSSGRGAPGSDFRTSSTAGPAFAGALARLAVRVDEALGRPPAFDLVEVGAGRGRLLLDTAGALPANLAARTRLTAVELAPRPPDLPPEVAWQPTLPTGVEGLLIANEWLDDVPCPVVETDDRGVRRVVLVGPDGREEPGPAVGGADAAWLDRWWPGLAQPGARAEVGLPRDLAWAGARAALRRGLAVAVDYAHGRDARPPLGTLAGYRAGRRVPPVPDGSCDLTAHVALDACAATGDRLTTQWEALRALGISGARPPLQLATSDPAAYVLALSVASVQGELLQRGGLGDFGWLFSPVRLGAGWWP